MWHELLVKLKIHPKKLPKLLGHIMYAILSVVFIFNFNACDTKKSKSSGSPPPPPPITNVPPGYYNGSYTGALCPNCGMNVSWAIFAGTDSTNANGTMKLSLDFYGDPNRGFNFYDPKIPLMYNGYVVVRGQLIISQLDPFSCYIPPGQYQVISLSAGMWQGGVVTSSYSGYGPTGLYLQATSPQGVVVNMMLAKGVIYNPTGTASWYPNKLGGVVVFKTYNGSYCYSNAYTEMY